MHVIANFFAFDDDGYATGYQGRIVHSYNKSEVQLREQAFFPIIRDRPNVLLLGDTGMTDGLEHDTVIKAGFLHDEDKLDVYLDAYDVVVTGDDTLAYVNELCKQLIRS
ncbi:hypothetical protein JXA12_05620 [Candidatus Woesearchaeota archaeon]|nr:hypothetical protein [Candidatus Woesearchaeota archaeon]